jgi:hypothetical protein
MIAAPPSKVSPKIERGQKQPFYCVTIIFPWAVDLIARQPKCAMTDSTFKAVKPYTLAILQLIFANESIPIPFGISPSETGASYMRTDGRGRQGGFGPPSWPNR